MILWDVYRRCARVVGTVWHSRRPHPVTAVNANFHFGSFTVVGRRAINIVFYTLAIHVHWNVMLRYDGETKKNHDIIFFFCFFSELYNSFFLLLFEFDIS